MFRSILYYSVVLLLLYFSACSHETIVKYEDDSGSTCIMNYDDTLQVVLTSNPTTGYEWKVDSLDKTVLKITGKTYIPDKVPPGTAGAGGKTIFYFTAAEKGSTPLKLIYHRPFEKHKDPVKTFVISVKVR